MDSVFVCETTASPEWELWCLNAGDAALASVLVPAGTTRSEAWRQLQAKQAQRARILSGCFQTVSISTKQALKLLAQTQW